MKIRTKLTFNILLVVIAVSTVVATSTRRLFTLIFAGCVPHDLVSSWNCLGLKAGIKLMSDGRTLAATPDGGEIDDRRKDESFMTFFHCQKGITTALLSTLAPQKQC